MIQRLVPLLGLDHGALGLTEEQFNALKEVGTFTTTTAPSTVTDPSVHELLTASTDSALSTVEESSTTETSDLSNSETRTNSSTDSTSTAEESNESVDSASSESSTISTSTSTTTTSTSTSEEIEENTQTTEVSESLSSSSEDPGAATSTDAATESTSTTESSTEHPDNFREPKVVNESEIESTIVPTTTTTSTVAESSESTTTEHSTENVAESSTAETAASTESTLAAETSPSSEVATSTVAVSAEVTTDVGLVMELHNELLNFTTFVQYEPEHEHFNTIPRLDSIAKHLSCDVLVASRSAASSVSANQLSQMETTELRNCLEVLGAIPWPRSDIGPVWRELKKKLGYHKSAMKPIKREEMIKLSNLLPAVVHEDVDLIDVRHEHIDGISIIGR